MEIENELTRDFVAFEFLKHELMINKTSVGPGYSKPDCITNEEYELFCDAVNLSRFYKIKDITAQDISDARLTYPEFEHNLNLEKKLHREKYGYTLVFHYDRIKYYTCELFQNAFHPLYVRHRHVDRSEEVLVASKFQKYFTDTSYVSVDDDPRCKFSSFLTHNNL